MTAPVRDGLDRAFAGLYFGVQALRRGVRPSEIRFSRSLLDSDRAVLEEHVRSRLVETHRAPETALEWLDDQPLTDRSDLRTAMERVIEAHPGHSIEVRKTSGSTGAPFRFAKDRDMTAMMDAVMWAAYGWHGIEPGQRHARFWGLPREPLSRMRRRAMDFLLHRRRLDAFDLSPRTALAFFRKLRTFQPHYIHAYPNLLLEFVEYCADADRDGRDLGVAVVVCGGELLPPSSRQTIGDFFDARVVNEYGCSESGLISIECESGCPHVLPVATYPQVQNGEDDRDSRSGEVVITDLYGTVAPLLRYRLHDHAEADQNPGCECGRELASLSPTIGRIDSFIETPARGKVYDAILAYSVPPEVFRFRAYQIDARNLYVEVVLRSTGSTTQSLEQLETTWERELGPGMHVTATAVEDIPKMESGKLAYFIPESDVSASVRARAAQG